MLALPMSVFANKGKEHFTEGMKYEQAQQWEKAAQEFTLAMAADPSNVDYQLHYRRAVFNASQAFMQQGRSLAEQRDYVGAYNAFRQAFGYDPVNQLAVSEMERMLRLEQVKQGLIVSNTSTTNDANAKTDDALGGGTPSQPQTRTPETDVQLKPEIQRTINFNGVDIKNVIKQLALDLNLNVMFDRQSFAQPRPVDLNLQKVTTAKALDLLFLQENLFFQKLDKRTILVADQSRRPQYQQLVVRTFFIANSDPDKIKLLIGQALPASVGRPQPIVVSDKDTNSLTVRDTAENVKLIGELLESLDKDRAEVVMDVNIYEVSRSNLLQLGNQLGSGTFNLGGSPGLSVLTSNAATSATNVGVNVASILAGVPTAGAAALVIPPSVLTAFQSKNNSKLLASTQIHAFNNEESSARIGQRVPVQTAQAFPFGVQQTGTTTPSVSQPFGGGGFPVINYEPTGLTLSFTPIVFPNLDVQVKMKIESKDVSGASTLTPTFTERTLQGTARVQNNRTMMLASVSQDVQSSGRQGLPILSGLPVLGRLFTSPTRDNRQVDIVIAVTPRVLRAPAVTPRDEEMRPSGTLQAPTTGSLEAMLRETERDEQIAAARRLPKDAVIQVPDAAPAYEPAVKTDAGDQAKVSEQQTAATTAPVNTSAQANVAALQTPSTRSATEANHVTASIQTDASMPQPKSAAITTSQNPPVLQTADVSTALKSLVSSPTNVSTTSLSAKQDTVLTPVTDVAIKSASNSTAANSAEPVTSLIEVGVTPEKSELKVGDKQQLQLRVKSDAPLGLALVMLRFDPKVMKVDSVSIGDLFANAKMPPTLTQSIDNHGMILISLVPAAGSAVTADGTIFNIEVEALAAGDSTLMFDLSNVNVVASDGRPLLLKLEPIKLTVK
jgi:general secretion pathway protein D